MHWNESGITGVSDGRKMAKILRKMCRHSQTADSCFLLLECTKNML